MLRTFVSFRSDIEGAVDGGPRGKTLVTIVGDGLAREGFEVEPPEERGGWAWSICMNDKQFQIESILGHVGDDEIEWLATNHLHLSFLSRIVSRGAARTRGEDHLSRYCQAIHRTLSSDERIREIRWHAESDFDGEVYDRWSPTP